MSVLIMYKVHVSQFYCTQSQMNACYGLWFSAGAKGRQELLAGPLVASQFFSKVFVGTLCSLGTRILLPPLYFSSLLIK
jgi:hypothetical protein